MLAFNGDHQHALECARLIVKWGIDTVVETGTLAGDTTRAFAELVPIVYTIDIEPSHWRGPEAPAWINRLTGDSGALLADLRRTLPERIFYYLDAHPLVTPNRAGHSPLLEELRAIIGAILPPVIVIHDFFNPLHPEYPFDTHDIGPYKFELIRPALAQIYGAGCFQWHYNSIMAGVACGVIYIEPFP